MLTVLGASGFIGSAIVKKAKEENRELYLPKREETLTGKDLGDVIYCIGLTADFRHRPFDTVEAHVCKLKHLLEDGQFTSLTYLSSTRIYSHCNELIVNERSLIPVDVSEPFDLFNSSKLAGECLTMNCGRENVRIARLSNVYGDDFTSENFITAIIKEAVDNRKVVLRSTMDSSKDYIPVNDVVALLIGLADDRNGSGIFNIASGINTTNEDIIKELQRITDCDIEVSGTAEKIKFPQVNINKIQKLFHYKPGSGILQDLEKIVHNYIDN